MAVGRPIADIMKVNLNQLVLLGAQQDAALYVGCKDVGEEGEYIKLQGRGAHKPILAGRSVIGKEERGGVLH